MNQTTTITIAYINPPGAGKKQATIKASDNRVFGIYPEKMTDYAVGKTYDIEFTSREWQGKTFYTIASAKLAASNPMVPTSAGNTAGGGDNRSNSIERQVAFKGAIELHAIEANKGAEVSLERIAVLTEGFADIIKNSGPVDAAQPPEQEVLV